MKHVTFSLTKKQLETVRSLRNGNTGKFWILGQVFIDANADAIPIGTTYFHYLNDEQGKIVNRAILRAQKIGAKKR